MSKEDYISKEIEEIIMSDEIFKSFKEKHKNKHIYDKAIFDLAILFLRFIKYHKGNFVFFKYNYIKFKNEFNERKEILSEEEKENFNNFILIIDKTREFNRENTFLDLLSHSYVIFASNQNYIYQKIVMLEEKDRINEIIQKF